MADFPITEGYFLLSGRNKENARKAISEAQERGFGADSVLTRHDGYLIPLGKGDVVETTPGTEGNDPVELDAEAVEAPDDSWKNDDIVEFAKSHGIDLGEATKKADMLAVINDSIPAVGEAEGDVKKEEEGE